MCSVNFIYNPNYKKAELQNAITAMVTISNHRGPSSTECLIDNNFAFGFNRLEIVGGNLGKQPIYDRDNNLILICNGEIFNHKELKEKYFKNQKFTTKSDTEIIMHLYKKFGENSISYLEGQFGFLLFDINKEQLILGRDRFGINPLFYYSHNNIFIAASEIKSILSTNLVKHLRLNEKSIIENLLFYGAVPPDTCFTNIYQLPPSTYAIYDLSTKSIKMFQYWEITVPNKKLKNMQVAKQQTKNLLTKSVQKRLQGISTPGVYVSGGLDSAIIGSIVNKLTNGKTEFFSIAFDDERYDESYYQKQVAKVLKVKLNQVCISIDDIIKNIKLSIFHVETPLIRCAPVPMIMLSQLVKKSSIKFVLCGEGADEMFAGYPVFLKNQSSFENKWNIIKQYLDIFQNKDTLLHADKVYKKLTTSNTKDDKISKNRKKEIHTKLSQYLLVSQGDRMSMANGVEQRFPFLDTDIANFAFSLDKQLLIKKDDGKIILRETFEKMLPPELLNRRKQGYLAPDDIVVTKILPNLDYNYLLTKSYFNKVKIFNFEKTIKLINKMESGDCEEKFVVNIILFVLTTHLLHDIFIEKHFPFFTLNQHYNDKS